MLCYFSGINSGVLLMNLKALRESIPWDKMLQEYREKYEKLLQFGDQCLLNAILHFHPGNYYNTLLHKDIIYVPVLPGI